MRVLVIEDNAALRESIAAGLTRAGHEVSAATDGDTALGALLSNQEPIPDVILLDLNMPSTSGQRFRVSQLGHPTLASIPTLIMSAAEVDSATPSALRPIAVASNPMALDMLLASIDEVVQPPEALKRCGCGRVYDSDKWRLLPLVGAVDNGREVGEHLELRQCPCRSTLARQLGPHAVSVPFLRIR